MLDKESIQADDSETTNAENVDDIHHVEVESSDVPQTPTFQKDGKTVQIIMNQYGNYNKQIAYAENVYESDLSNSRSSNQRCVIVKQSTGESFMLRDGIFRIGRNAKKCDLVLEDEAVSLLHAEVYRQDDAWIICDVNSCSGVYIAGTKLLPGRKYELEDGDDVQISDEHFLVELK